VGVADQRVKQLGRLADNKHGHDDDEHDRRVAVDARPGVRRSRLVGRAEHFRRRTPRSTARRPTIPTAVPLA